MCAHLIAVLHDHVVDINFDACIRPLAALVPNEETQEEYYQQDRLECHRTACDVNRISPSIETIELTSLSHSSVVDDIYQ